MAESKVLSYIRNIFRRDNFQGEDGPRDPGRQLNPYYPSNLNFGNLYNLGTGYDNTPNHYGVQEDLLTRYADYEMMDDVGELSNALDIFADESCQTDVLTKQIVHIHSEDNRVNNALNTCFHKNMKIDEEIWDISRTVCKYGNMFAENIVTEHEGVIGIKQLPTPQMRRIDDLLGGLIGFVYDKTGMFQISDAEFLERLNNRQLNADQYKESFFSRNVYEDWEVTHFRILSRNVNSVYGFSILEASRVIMKRLQLLEDAALLYKLSRAPQRFAFNIDVGDIPPNEVMKYLNDVKNQLRKTKVLDPNTGKLDLMAAIINAQEDLFIPVRKEKPAMTIENIGGFESAFYTDDLQYFKDKLYAAIKIPKDYLNYTEDSVSKANLSQMDVRFSRSILRVQNTLVKGLKNTGRVHLASIGYDPDLVEYDIWLTSPSAIFELALLEVKQTQLEIAEKFRVFVDDVWIMKNILKFSDEDITGIKDRLKKQKDIENPFAEQRFPALESNNRSMNTEVRKIMDDMGEQILASDKGLSMKLNELKKLAFEIKASLSNKKR